MATRRTTAILTAGFFILTVLPGGYARGETLNELKAAERPASDKGEQSLKDEKRTQQTATALRGSVRAALKSAANAKDQDQEESARTLVALYRDLQQDTSLNVTERASLRAATRYRLARISKQMQSRATRDAAMAPRSKPTVATQKPNRDEPLPGELQQFPVAAQQFAFPQQQNPRAGAMGGNPFQAGQRAAPPVADRGQELVELIENTIAPDTWAVHGGLGTIHYYRPSHALIVNQSGQEHDQLGGLLLQLRK